MREREIARGGEKEREGEKVRKRKCVRERNRGIEVELLLVQ